MTEQPVTVPDTLDLAQHARLAIHGITGNLDPDIGPDMWFHCEMSHQTPFMKHIFCDNACTPNYDTALSLLRLMSGSDEGLDMEARMRERLLSQIEDGIYWNKAEPDRPWRCRYNWDKDDANPKGEDLASPVGNAYMMNALMTWREVDGDDRWDALIAEMLGGMEQLENTDNKHRRLCRRPPEPFNNRS